MLINIIIMDILNLNIKKNYKEFLEKLDVDSLGINILSQKMDINHILIKNIHFAGANILKQDALSIGADVAVPRGTIIGENKFVDILLIANDRRLKVLSKKENSQPFGLKNVAKELKNILETKENSNKTENNNIKIMGILNINDDSFYSKSRVKDSNILDKIQNFIDEGADIIDIGAVSSRPNSSFISVDEEMNRVKYIIEEIYKNKLYEKITFSLDTFEPKVADFALNNGFKIINNIKGINEEMAQVISNFNAKTVIMHMQGTPKNMQNKPFYKDIILDIDRFFQEKLEIADKFNIKDIILDVGIGFGKTLEHNVTLIQHLNHFKKFNKEILIGASRKSMIDAIYKSNIEDRLAGTLAIHLKAIENGASIVRCHDIKEHKQAIEINKIIC